jgi:hypothetical protein
MKKTLWRDGNLPLAALPALGVTARVLGTPAALAGHNTTAQLQVVELVAVDGSHR